MLNGASGAGESGFKLVVLGYGLFLALRKGGQAGCRRRDAAGNSKPAALNALASLFQLVGVIFDGLAELV